VAMGFPTGPDPFSLLHHHRCQPPRTRVIQMLLAHWMTKLVIEQIALVIDQSDPYDSTSSSHRLAFNTTRLPFWQDISPRMK
jgi:hypothetical protein